jgi:hypothetical protein
MNHNTRPKSGPNGSAARGMPATIEPEKATFERTPRCVARLGSRDYRVEVETQAHAALGAGRWWRLTPWGRSTDPALAAERLCAALIVGEPRDGTADGPTPEARDGLWCSCPRYLASDGRNSCDHIRGLTALGLLRPILAEIEPATATDRRGITDERVGAEAEEGLPKPLPPTPPDLPESPARRTLPGQAALPFAEPAVASPVLPPVPALRPYRSDRDRIVGGNGGGRRRGGKGGVS